MNLPNLPVSRVVNVQIQMSPLAASTRNFGAMLIVGSSDVVDATERIRTYSNSELTVIASEFGTEAPEYLAAVAFFAQSPKPSNVQIGRWIKEDTAGLLKGRILATVEQEIERFTAITTGEMTVNIDASQVTLANVSFADCTNLNGVASAVTTALAGKGTCFFDGSRFVIKSSTTGTTSSVTNASDSELSKILGFDESTTAVGGAKAETLEEATVALLDFTTWYGAFYACDYELEDALKAAALINAATPYRICAFTSKDTQELDGQQRSSLGYKLSEVKNNRAIVCYSSTDKSMAMSVLGRMSTVNFNGSNTTITLKFKQAPGVAPEYLRTSQANALQKNHVNVFAQYQNDTAILQEGTMAGGFFIDEVHGLDWLQNRVETDLWNLLYTSTTKIGQDDVGVNDLLTTINKSIDAGVKNGLIAPGVWNGDSFGALNKGDTLSSGYYVYISPLDEQAQSDREQRKAPPIQVAVKLRGAIHFVDVLITVNR